MLIVKDKDTNSFDTVNDESEENKVSTRKAEGWVIGT